MSSCSVCQSPRSLRSFLCIPRLFFSFSFLWFQMWIDQNFPEGEPRKLHIHGNKQQVEAAKAEVKHIMENAPANRPPARVSPAVDSPGAVFACVEMLR